MTLDLIKEYIIFKKQLSFLINKFKCGVRCGVRVLKKPRKMKTKDSKIGVNIGETIR